MSYKHRSPTKKKPGRKSMTSNFQRSMKIIRNSNRDVFKLGFLSPLLTWKLLFYMTDDGISQAIRHIASHEKQFQTSETTERKNYVQILWLVFLMVYFGNTHTNYVQITIKSMMPAFCRATLRMLVPPLMRRSVTVCVRACVCLSVCPPVWQLTTDLWSPYVIGQTIYIYGRPME